MPQLAQIVPTANLRYVNAQGNNAAQLQADLNQKLVAFLAANPDADFLDLLIAGGGAGNVFSVYALVTTVAAPGSPTPLGDITIALFDATTAALVQAQVESYLGALQSEELVAHDDGVAGNGAVYLVGVATRPTVG